MDKLKSLDDLKNLKNHIIQSSTADKNQVVLAVGMATCGIAAGAQETLDALSDEISKQNLKHVKLVSTGCAGFCYAEPLVEVRIPNQEIIRYGNVDSQRAREIVRKHIVEGVVLDDAILGRERGT